jgi:putative IMPACT (imprinted ancient) family translation regulator
MGTIDDDDRGSGRRGTRTFVPPNGTRYGQSIRHFPIEIASPISKYRVENITRTDPFRPPKSGPSELMIAHVCGVNCIEQVQWAISNLLFEDKKVSTASHNMFAYRFRHVDDGRIVHDNDDDGERGSGNKLSSLLEMSNATNVLVVVSRWFGGVHLGSSRFKWIASVARDGLERGGFIKGRCSVA